MELLVSHVSTYRASNLTVVQMDPRMDVVALLFGIEQKSRKLEAEIHVVRAATPTPVGQHRSAALALRIASARLQFAQTAGFRHGMGHSGR